MVWAELGQNWEKAEVTAAELGPQIHGGQGAALVVGGPWGGSTLTPGDRAERRVFMAFITCRQPWSLSHKGKGPRVATETVLNALDCIDFWGCHFLPDNSERDLITVALNLADSISTAGCSSSSAAAAQPAVFPTHSCSCCCTFPGPNGCPRLLVWVCRARTQGQRHSGRASIRRDQTHLFQLNQEP